jgi:hypothetical protein
LNQTTASAESSPFEESKRDTNEDIPVNSNITQMDMEGKEVIHNRRSLLRMPDLLKLAI